ncbi:hypothetical protein H3H37_13785 [Duganella sp. LX20W]|uniref:DUF2486 family protein n=1 Tax=Rugamonas brunnea TaxID=2758569 RepID=A0A7W2IC20_9BURK|nr:hypothetical protein [Rugamonas brunnea]MBA5638126.1 hypothetical protein [Rugamonas brunnea]
MTPAQPFDASIPVLTEVLRDDPAPAADGAALAHADHGARLEAQALAGWSEHEWEVLERRLATRIVQQLQSRVDFVLEQRIKDSMAEVLSHALRDLTAEIRGGLQDTIEKIVARAVSQELTHLQARK